MVGLKMVFGPQMDIYKDPVVKIFPNMLTFEGALGYGHAPAQFQTFFQKTWKNMLGPQVDILARGPFWGKKMVPKKMVLWRNDFVVRF